MADYSGYLDPSIVNYVQGVDPSAMPPVDALASSLGPRGTESTIDPPPPPPPRAPLPGELSKHIGLFGAPSGDETYGLSPEVLQHIQGAPQPAAESVSTTPSVTGGALPTDPGMVAAAPIAPAPDYVAATAPDLTNNPKAVAASNKAYDKRTAAQAAYDASPEGLAAKADSEQRGAIAKEQQANTDALAAEQAQNTATSNALVASQQRQAEQDKKDAAATAEDQANVQKYTQQYAQQVKDAADYKVDTNRDVGTRGLIAIALSGIGDALDHIHGPNKAAQIIEAQIDKRISDQWAAKGALKDKANDTKGVLGTFRQNADDDRQAQALHSAAETKRVADEIRQIGAQYANPAAKARAEAVAAQLDTKAAGITMQEAQRKADAIKQQREEADRKAGLGLQYAQLNQNDAHFKAQQDQAMEFHKDDIAEKIVLAKEAGDTKGAAALEKQQQQLQEGGLMAPTGTRKDAQGNTVAKFNYLKQDDGAPFVAPKDVAPKMREQFDGYTKYINALDRVRQIRSESGGHVFNTEQARAAKQALEDALMAGHQALGVEGFRGNILEVVESKITGGADINSLYKDVLPELNTARTQAVRDLNGTLHSRYGYTGDDLKFPDPMAEGKPAETVAKQRNRTLEATVPEQDQDMLSMSGYASRMATPEGRETMKRANEAGVMPAQLQLLDQLGAQLKDPDQAEPARKALQETIANPAVPANVKAHARALLGADLAPSLAPQPQEPTQTAPVGNYVAARTGGQ